ncbi:MAG: LytR/AlgR family response regulator transcription factor [Kineosporiaceae bacterium]
MPGRAPRPGRDPGPGLRVLVVDDEPPALAELVYLVERDVSVMDVVAAANAGDALRHLGTGRFDAVLTDVQMPGFDGLALARAVARLARPPAVVFVTAHEEHAVAAFDLDVADYVLKPVRPERLAEALRRVRVPPPGAPGAATGPDERIAVDLGGVTRFVQRSAVEWAEAQGDYVRLHVGGKSHLVRVALGALEERWAGAGFARAHRSVLVNLGHVREVRTDGGRWSVVTTAGDRLPVSRRQARDLRAALAEALDGPEGVGA